MTTSSTFIEREVVAVTGVKFRLLRRRVCSDGLGFLERAGISEECADPRATKRVIANVIRQAKARVLNLIPYDGGFDLRAP